MEEFNNDFEFKNKPDETTPRSAENLNIALKNTRAICSDTAGAHNGIFRGKDITNYFDDGSIWERISSGKFTDLFVGDYIVKNNITWRIAGFDTYLNKGDQNQGLKTHHAVIVPDEALTTSKMNASNTSENGYLGSDMVKNVLGTVLTDYIEPIFSTHILEYRSMLTNKINSTGYNRLGTATGCSSGWEWATRKLDLMSEVEVYGSQNWSSSGYDSGSNNAQLPLFKLAPEFISNKHNGWYWLSSIVTALTFAGIDGYGLVGNHGASNSHDVRPRFFID